MGSEVGVESLKGAIRYSVKRKKEKRIAEGKTFGLFDGWDTSLED